MTSLGHHNYQNVSKIDLFCFNDYILSIYERLCSVVH